jgi:aminoglycoside phosphotransferase family enzyme/predicted kinase
MPPAPERRIAQADVVTFLCRPDVHGLKTEAVERLDTHISVVFLAGRRAYKMKRAVTFPYLDYSTLDFRRAACERELLLNRRTARSLYRAVVAVTRQPDGSLALGGGGEPVEWLVEMTRFDQDALFDRMAGAGRLDRALTARLARAVASFHERAQPRRDCDGASTVRRVVDGNLLEMLDQGAGTLDPDRCRALHARSSDEVERLSFLMDARRMHGLVRQCHGDLHLHNVVLIDGEPVLFDAIEFNDDFACIDVAYDFAFLLMDLLHRNLRPHANAALNAWLDERRDYASLMLLPLYLSCRAAIRSKVSLAEAAVQPAAASAEALRRDARAYLQLAERVLTPVPASLTAIGGFSGSGKSTLAAAMAPALGALPGAVVLRTDVIRKRMFGVEELHRLPSSAYEPDVTAQVYARLFHAAEACLRSGQSVVLDAVFGDPVHRETAGRVAADAGVPFTGLWLDVPWRVAARRLRARVADASDATVDVLRTQVKSRTGRVQWVRVDARGDPDEILRRALDAAAERRDGLLVNGR